MSVKKQSTAILLLNIGSPKSSGIFDVASYLSEFLGNSRVINLPFLLRMTIVCLFIVPARLFKVAKRYKKLENLYELEFPINKYGESVKNQLSQKFSDKNTEVFWGTAYGKYNLEESLETIKEKNFEKLIVLPLFPQYAVSSSGVVIEKVLTFLRKSTYRPSIHIIRSFYTHPDFIRVWVEKVNAFHPENYDLILFSYHGLPIKQAKKSKQGKYNYEKACRDITHFISQKADIHPDKVETVFQSQMTAGWLAPFLSTTLKEKPKQGIKNILVVMPGFVSDCLETVVELEEYRDSFIEAGGENLTLVDSLNNDPMWIDALENILTKR